MPKTRSERDARYNRSEKGRARSRRYNRSLKGRERNRRYWSSLTPEQRAKRLAYFKAWIAEHEEDVLWRLKRDTLKWQHDRERSTYL